MFRYLKNLMIENEATPEIPPGTERSRDFNCRSQMLALLNAATTDCVYGKSASGMCYRIFMI
jgi:hypothetical protein